MRTATDRFSYRLRRLRTCGRSVDMIFREALRERLLSNDPNRFWWFSLVLVFGGSLGFWYFEQRMFPASSGVVGAIVGFLLGSFLAALFEDYLDQSAR
jgi:hypothetical protein